MNEFLPYNSIGKRFNFLKFYLRSTNDFLAAYFFLSLLMVILREYMMVKEYFAVYNNNAKMDQNQHVQPAQEAYGENQYQSNPVTTPTVLPTQTSDSSLSPSYPRQHPNDP